jgi:hypothetical protein
MKQPLVLPFALRLLGQHLTLIYPVLLFSLLMESLRPDGELPTLQWRWAALLLLLMLIKVAFTCGWYGCVCAVVQDALKSAVPAKTVTPAGDMFVKQPEAEESPSVLPRTFKYFKVFFPTVGRYFLPVAVGELLLTLFQVAVALGALWLAVQNWGIPNIDPQVITALQTPQQVSAWLLSLPVAELTRLEHYSWLLIALGAGMLLTQALTQFWVFFVLLLQQNPLKALLRSVGFTVTHTFGLLVQFTPVWLLSGLFILLSMAKLGWLAFVGMMGATLTLLLMLLMSTSYFYQQYVQAQLLPLDDGQNGPVSSKKTAI